MVQGQFCLETGRRRDRPSLRRTRYRCAGRRSALAPGSLRTATCEPVARVALAFVRLFLRHSPQACGRPPPDRDRAGGQRGEMPSKELGGSLPHSRAGPLQCGFSSRSRRLDLFWWQQFRQGRSIVRRITGLQLVAPITQCVSRAFDGLLMFLNFVVRQFNRLEISRLIFDECCDTDRSSNAPGIGVDDMLHSPGSQED